MQSPPYLEIYPLESLEVKPFLLKTIGSHKAKQLLFSLTYHI
jgi:hypothetical protein